MRDRSDYERKWNVKMLNLVLKAVLSVFESNLHIFLVLEGCCYHGMQLGAIVGKCVSRGARLIQGNTYVKSW